MPLTKTSGGGGASSSSGVNDSDGGTEGSDAIGSNDGNNAAADGTGADGSQSDSANQPAEGAGDDSKADGNAGAGDQTPSDGDQSEQNGVYPVSSNDEFNQAVSAIALNEASEATIVLAADVNAPDFAGVEGKKVTVTSKDGECHTIYMATSLVGDVTFGAVKYGITSANSIFANGHVFETTSEFQGFTQSSLQLYGGGSDGNDVEGGTRLMLRGVAELAYVTGGGLNSNVGGSTNILIDGAQVVIDNLTGGGRATTVGASATVGGDTHVTVVKGLAKGLYGGGLNETSNKDNKEIARVYGDTYVTTGEEGAQSYQAYIGTAMESCAGSYYSMVNSTHFTILPGTINYLPDANNFFSGGGLCATFGAGRGDTVLGTVSIDVKSGGCGSRIGLVCGGGRSGSSEIKNQSGEKYAVHIVYDNDDAVADTKDAFDDYEHGIYAGSYGNIPTTIDGNVLVDVGNGDFGCIKLGSYDDDDDSVINGDAAVHVTGGRVARIEGNAEHYRNKRYASSATYDGCGTVDKPQQTGYLYRFKQVALENEAQVSIDSDPSFSRSLPNLTNCKTLSIQFKNCVSRVTAS